jgi:hypothetical protein
VANSLLGARVCIDVREAITFVVRLRDREGAELGIVHVASFETKKCKLKSKRCVWRHTEIVIVRLGLSTLSRIFVMEKSALLE